LNERADLAVAQRYPARTMPPPTAASASPLRTSRRVRPVHARGGASMAIAGVGRVYLWHGGSLWIGHSAGGGNVHAHHAIQICLPLDVRVRFRRSAMADWDDYDGAIVRPDEPHQFDGRDGRVAQLFVEPETALGRVFLDQTAGMPITPLTRGQALPLAQALFAAFESRKDEAAMQVACEQVLRGLVCCAPQCARVDPRVTRVLDALRRQVADPPTLPQAAALAHLSPGRFRHLFVEQTGISFRAYLVWLRLNEALAAFNEGRNWTEAAHRAGFADSPHLSRSFRRVFGVSPVMLVRE
jgi:AraC-like DNA-binding protein